MYALFSWCLAVILTLSPLGARRVIFPGWEETEWQRGVRYIAIAQDVATVTWKACERHGKHRLACAKRYAGWILGVALHESQYEPSVDAGRCYRGTKRSMAWPRCDFGRAFTMWQMRVTGDRKNEVTKDRRAAIEYALSQILRSLGVCKHLVEPLRMSAYASGSCQDEGRAAEASRELWRDMTKAERVRAP